MKNWILIDDKKFEIFSSNLSGEYGNNPEYVRAFKRHFEVTSSPPVLTTNKNKIRLLIRFEDLNLPIWNKDTKIDFFIKINRTHLSGNFDVFSIEGVSGFNGGRIVDLVVTNLNSGTAKIDEVRRVQLSDILS